MPIRWYLAGQWRCIGGGFPGALRIGDQLLSRRRQSFQQNLRLRPVWMYIPHQVHRNIGVNEDQIDSPVQSHAASGRYQLQAGDSGSPRRVEWPLTWLRDRAPTSAYALREAFAGPTPQQSHVHAGQESGCPTFPRRPVRPGVACSYCEYNVLPVGANLPAVAPIWHRQARRASVTGYSQEREPPWKCSLRPIKKHSPAAPWKAGGCIARKKPYRKRWRCGKTANAAAWRFWRPSMTPALRFPVVKAVGSRSNPCANLPPRGESADAPA